MLRFDKATYLSFFFTFILSKSLSNSLRGSYVLLFSEFINIVSILFYNFIEFTIYVAFSLARYKEYFIWWISFSKLSDVLPAFTCVGAISNLWSKCLGVNILRAKRSETLAKQTESNWHQQSDILATQDNILRCPSPRIALYLSSDAIVW